MYVCNIGIHVWLHNRQLNTASIYISGFSYLSQEITQLTLCYPESLGYIHTLANENKRHSWDRWQKPLDCGRRQSRPCMLLHTVHVEQTIELVTPVRHSVLELEDTCRWQILLPIWNQKSARFSHFQVLGKNYQVEHLLRRGLSLKPAPATNPMSRHQPKSYEKPGTSCLDQNTSGQTPSTSRAYWVSNSNTFAFSL